MRISLKKLVDENPFDVPGTLIDQQKKAVQDDLGANLKVTRF